MAVSRYSPAADLRPKAQVSRVTTTLTPINCGIRLSLAGRPSAYEVLVLTVATRFARLRRARDRHCPDGGDPLRPAPPRSRSPLGALVAAFTSRRLARHDRRQDVVLNGFLGHHHFG